MERAIPPGLPKRNRWAGISQRLQRSAGVLQEALKHIGHHNFRSSAGGRRACAEAADVLVNSQLQHSRTKRARIESQDSRRSTGAFDTPGGLVEYMRDVFSQTRSVLPCGWPRTAQEYPSGYAMRFGFGERSKQLGFP